MSRTPAPTARLNERCPDLLTDIRKTLFCKGDIGRIEFEAQIPSALSCSCDALGATASKGHEDGIAGVGEMPDESGRYG